MSTNPDISWIIILAYKHKAVESKPKTEKFAALRTEHLSPRQVSPNLKFRYLMQSGTKK